MLLQTLGGLGLEGSGFSRPKPLLLLAYLSLEGPKPRRYLADLFFMEAKDPFNSLSRALSYLRKEVPDAIEADHQKAWTTLKCDAVELLSLADKRQFEACVELYGGPFVETLAIELGSELEEWVYGTREYLAGRMREALLQTAEQEALQHNFAQAASHAETAYTLSGAPELEPEHFERVYRLLSAGSSPRAAEVRDEAQGYGIDLVDSSRVAKAQFQPALKEDPEIPNNLPPPKTSFVGREEELRLIAEQLADTNCRLLTLHGMGGIGKSRLAMQAAYEQLEQGNFKDGVFFVGLDALSSADLIPSSVAEAVGLELQGQEDTLKQVERFIGKKQMLLVLDNFEHLMEGATLPSELLQACLNLKLVVTSREILKLKEEWVLSLTGLTIPSKSKIMSEALEYPSVQLFISRAKSSSLSYIADWDEFPHILSIIHLIEGSPLGIELAAVWVKTLSTHEIAHEIQNSLNLFKSASRNVPDRHKSIQAVLEHSWNLLSTKEKLVLKSLAIFQGDFSRQAASEVANATLPLLASLIDKSLLKANPTGKYGGHPLLFQYLREKLASEPENEAEIQLAYVQYYLKFLKEFSSIEQVGQKQSLEAIESAIHNVLNAATITLHKQWKSDFVAYLRLLVIDSRYFDGRGHTSQSLNLLIKAISIAKQENDLVTAHYLSTKLGNTYRELLGDIEKAVGAYEEALQLAQAIEDKHRETILLSVLGMALSENESSKASDYLERAHDLAKANNDDFALFQVLQNKGYVAFLNTDYERLKRLSLKALDIARKLKTDPNVDQVQVDRMVFFALLNVGGAERYLKRFEQALTYLNQALEMSTALGNQLWMAYSLEELGDTYHAANERQHAKDMFIKALYLFEQNNAVADIEKIRNFMLVENYKTTNLINGGEAVT